MKHAADILTADDRDTIARRVAELEADIDGRHYSEPFELVRPAIHALCDLQRKLERHDAAVAYAADPMRQAGYEGKMKGRRCFVWNRATPCGCGCEGRDPWHRASYWRVVTVTGPGVGTVRMPYSNTPVRVELNRYVWNVDRSSIVFDK